MARFSPDEQPEVFLSHRDISHHVSRAVSEGRLRKLGPRLYTPNVNDDPSDVVGRNRWQIVALLFPGAVVSHRTALEGQPAPDGSVFLTGTYDRLVELPGLTVSLRKGPGPLDGDQAFVGRLWMASEARAFLEVLAPSRARRTVSRGLARPEVEDRLERKLRQGGPEALNRIRDRAREIAEQLGREPELRILDELIGTLLGTRDARLEAPVARARARGEPWDGDRVEMFQGLFGTLRGQELPLRPDDVRREDFRHLSFYDAYFSNYIEGTEFEVEEAAAIVFEGAVPEARTEDAHDVLGTFRLISRRDLMGTGSREVEGPEEFLDRLRTYHGRMLAQRPATLPGRFKDIPNRAGATVFVAPDLVRGTLRQGLALLGGLESALARAIFVSVLIAEVHPFRDGNGRMARVMMNAELISRGERRIVIPIGYRDDYLSALRAFSRQGRTDPVVQMFDRAQQFTAELDFSHWDGVRSRLTSCGAFGDPDSTRLRLPSELGLATRNPRTGEPLQ